MLSTMLLLGCGALGANPFDDTRRATGIAPWTDLGPVEFCLSRRRLAPANSSPLGICIPEDADSTARCGDNDDCNSRERCLCGQCTAVACERDRDCGPDMSCDVNEDSPRCARRCISDDVCPSGEECQLGACRRPCQSSDECQRGELCSERAGRCIAPQCSGDAGCLTGERCKIQRAPQGLEAPTAVVVNDELVLYFVSEGSVWRAVGSLANSFVVDPEEPLLEGRSPAALLDQGEIVLYFEQEGAIERSVSADGVDFSASTTAILPTESWEESGLAAPAVAASDSGITLAYATVDGRAIGLATSADGRQFERAKAPVLVPSDVQDPLLWREVTRIADPAVIVDQGGGQRLTRLYFAAQGTETSSNVKLGTVLSPVPNFSVGYAASVGNEFETYPFNPIFDRAVGFLNHVEETGPAVVLFQGKYLLFYEAGRQGNPRTENIGVAVNPTHVPSL